MKNAITQEFFWNNTGRNGQVCMAINITELTLFRARVWWALFWKTLGSDKAWEHKRPGKYQNIIICFGDTLLFFMACKNILEIPAAGAPVYGKGRVHGEVLLKKLAMDQHEQLGSKLL